MQYWPRITQNEDAVYFSLISVVVTDTMTGRQLTGTFWLTTTGHGPSMKTVKAETQVRFACYSTWRSCSQVAPQTRRVAGTIKNAACWLAQLWAHASVALLYSPPPQRSCGTLNGLGSLSYSQANPPTKLLTGHSNLSNSSTEDLSQMSLGCVTLIIKPD